MPEKIPEEKIPEEKIQYYMKNESRIKKIISQRKYASEFYYNLDQMHKNKS